MMKMIRATENKSADSAPKDLYRLGVAAAWMVAILTLGEMITFTLFPQPITVSGWFALFQDNWMIGLLDFWVLEIPMYVLFTVVFLALYLALRKTVQGYMAIALVLALLGSSVFLATNNPFAMLSLSKQYAAAATDMERSTLLAAGQAVLTNTGQRAAGGFNTGLFLVSIAGLIASVAMLQSNLFGQRAGVVGIWANGLSLVDFLRQALTQSPIITLLTIIPNALFLMTWYGSIGLKLRWLGRKERS